MFILKFSETLTPQIKSVLFIQVRPFDDGDRLPTPSPEPSPKPKKKSAPRSTRSSRRLYPRIPSDISLTTISEEPTQYSSHEIIVEPEVIVETTTVPMNGTQHSTNSSRNVSLTSLIETTTVPMNGTQHSTNSRRNVSLTSLLHVPYNRNV